MTLPMISEWAYLAINISYAVMVASCIIVVISENRNPIKSLAWVTALLFLPVVGLLFYLFFGRTPRNNLLARRNKRRILNHQNRGKRRASSLSASKSNTNLAILADKLTEASVTMNNGIKVFTSGQEKFNALKKDLRNASESIFLQYYIFNNDTLGNEIADLLIEKAKEGVKVYVIYDHVGSFSANNSFFRRMREQGVNVHPFFRVTFPQLANRINWRNHRKIVVIDRQIGYIGGMNIADRYVAGDKKFPVWRDTHFRVEGEIVESLMYSFLQDWNFMKPDEDFHIPDALPSKLQNDIGMQLVTSSPTDNWHNLSLTFLKAIGAAQKSVFIQTPYFLPTDAIAQVLEAAALAHIDVKIMIPRKSDSRMLTYASFSYVSRFLKAGASIYLYGPGMLHSKMMIIDDNLVSVGSTNFDFRSFENNFEGNIFVYDKGFNRTMRDIFFNDLKHCTRITQAQWSTRPRTQRIFESLIRLLAPIL